MVTRVCVCLSLAACPHYCTDLDVTWGNGRECPLLVHYWVDLQSVRGFRCSGNSAEREMSASACTHSMPGLFVGWLYVRISQKAADSLSWNFGKGLALRKVIDVWILGILAC